MQLALSNAQVDLLYKLFKNNKNRYNVDTLDQFLKCFTDSKIIHHGILKNILFEINQVHHIDFKQLDYIIDIQTDDYIIGTQINHIYDYTLKIISFKKLMILDYDNIEYTELVYILEKFPSTFLVYKTTNGYHVYDVSREYNYYDYDTLKLMNQMKCDKWYVSFTKYAGFVTRLEHKHDRPDEKFVESLVGQVNNHVVLQKLVDLVKFKDDLITSQSQNTKKKTENFPLGKK
jgi:hypothetical protein